MKFILLFFTALVIVSCNNESIQKPVSTKKQKIINQIKENKISKSKAYMEYESRAIDTLIQIKGWEMETSQTGMRWQMTHSQNCDALLPKKGDFIDVEIEILDIYEKVIFKKQQQTIRFRKEIIENGLDEALSKMCVGSKAKLVLPSHLAFGLRGHQNDVRSNQVLIYNVEFINKK